MSTEFIPYKEPWALAGLAAKLPALFLPDEKTAERFFVFFTANIRNKKTRRAYYQAEVRFADWCEGRGLANLTAVRPVHVAGYIEELQGELAKPSVKQHLAALRVLFDWLVVGHALELYMDEYLTAAEFAGDSDSALAHHRPQDRHAATPDPAGRLSRHRAACPPGGHQNQNRQSFVARHRDHGKINTKVFGPSCSDVTYKEPTQN